jgi:sugar phosphate isomerase/epimerase
VQYPALPVNMGIMAHKNFIWRCFIMKHVKTLGIVALTVSLILNLIACDTGNGGGGGSGGGILDSSQIGLQLYTVRGLVTNDRAGDKAFVQKLVQTIKDIGYDYCEPFGACFNLSPNDWKDILQTTGMKVSGLHHTLGYIWDPTINNGAGGGRECNGIFNNAALTEEMFEKEFYGDDRFPESNPLGKYGLKAYLDAFGINYTIINYAGWSTSAQWDIFFESLRRYVTFLNSKGIKVGFHSHNHEYAQYGKPDSRSKTGQQYTDTAIPNRIYDKIVELCDIIEIDLAWAARGGIVPSEAIKEYAPGGRYGSTDGNKLQYLHMKDVSLISRDGNAMSYRHEEIGDGTINWPEVVKVAKAQNIVRYVVEEDSNHYPDVTTITYTPGSGSVPDLTGMGSMRSATASFNYIKNMFIERSNYPAYIPFEAQSNKISNDKLSVQLYSVRSKLNPVFSGTYADDNAKRTAISNELQKIKNIGFKNVELWNFFGFPSNANDSVGNATGYAGQQVKAILDGLGLKASSIHQNVIDVDSLSASQKTAAETKYSGDSPADAWTKYVTDLRKDLVANLKALGLNHIFIASGGFTDYNGAGPFLTRVNNFRTGLNSNAVQGTGASALGWPITVNYHTHSQEFAQPDGIKVSFFDMLMNTVAKVELDTHWALRAGVDPVDLLFKYPKQITYLHIKDISYVTGYATQAATNESQFFNFEEIGAGTTNWDRLFRAANWAGVQYFVIEQDANYLSNGNMFNGGTKKDGTGFYYEDGDPYESLKASYNYLAAKHF